MSNSFVTTLSSYQLSRYCSLSYVKKTHQYMKWLQQSMN